MIPNMSNTLSGWQQSVKLKTLKQTTKDFTPAQTITTQEIKAVVQVAEKQSLKFDSINWSRSYIQIHSKTNIQVSQFIEYKGKDYLIVSIEDYSDYGYCEVIGEETGKKLLA